MQKVMDVPNISSRTWTTSPSKAGNQAHSRAGNSTRSIREVDEDEIDEGIYEDTHKAPFKTLRRGSMKSTRNSAQHSRSPGKKTLLNGVMCTVNNDLGFLSASPGEAVRSPWDADDDEFDNAVYTDLKQSVTTFNSRYGTFKRSSTDQRPCIRPTYTLKNSSMRDIDSPAYHNIQNLGSLQACRTVIFSPTKPSRDSDDSSGGSIVADNEILDVENAFSDTVAELTDADCMEPTKGDLHDDILATLFTNAYSALPPYYPARHMHIVDWKKLYDDKGAPIFKHAHPRLCDAVATVIHEAGSKVLDGFLDSRIHEFKWTRGVHPSGPQPSVIIRRLGNSVTVGTYHTHGFKYFWSYYVKATIDFTGKWSETFASTAQATSNVTQNGIDWDNFELVESTGDRAQMTDPKFALYIGRHLARWMLKHRVWMYNLHAGDVCEWVADGCSTRVMMQGRTDPEMKSQRDSEE